ncbi:MAG: hypothetical protein ACYS7Y_11565 [Planctomycetota bacterium]
MLHAEGIGLLVLLLTPSPYNYIIEYGTPTVMMDSSGFTNAAVPDDTSHPTKSFTRRDGRLIVVDDESHTHPTMKLLMNCQMFIGITLVKDRVKGP